MSSSQGRPDPLPDLAKVVGLVLVAAGTAKKQDISAMEGYTTLTRPERWTVNASDSQFNALSGALGGFTSGIVTCPLDVIKTKLQAQGGLAALQRQKGLATHAKTYEGLVGTARVIWHQEGVRGMYRGLGPIILGYLPTWAVWFTVYNNSKEWMRQYQKTDFVVNFWSSIVAGGCSTLVTNPIWVIKTRLMSQASRHSQYSLYPKGTNSPTSRPTLSTPWHYRSTFDAARKMYTTEGILSFYSGLAPALLGLTHVAVQFPTYEYLKVRFTGRPMGAVTDKHDSKPHWFGILSASILSKILASSATYPHEVIRTRLQTQRRPTIGQEYMQGLGGAAFSSQSGAGAAAQAQLSSSSSQQKQVLQPRYNGVLMTFRTMLKEEGWRAFYAGMGTSMMRAVPASTVTMLTYEYVMQQLQKTRQRGRQKLGLPAYSRGQADCPADAVASRERREMGQQQAATDTRTSPS